MKSPKASRLSLQTKVSRLTPTDLVALHPDLEEIQHDIAQRAYELFEARGREHGHDLDDWYQAESELLRPVSFTTSEREDRLSLQANVFGFEETDLRVGVEPRRLIILGKKPRVATHSGDDTTRPSESNPGRLLCLIDLPVEIQSSGTTIELKAGVLSFELPKNVEHIATKEVEAA